MTQEEALEQLIGVELDHSSDLLNLPEEWADKFEKHPDLEEQIEELQGHMMSLGSCEKMEDARANATLALATIAKMPRFAQSELRSLKNDLREALAEVQEAGYVGGRAAGRASSRVADVILEQLGGVAMLRAMINAHDILYAERYVQFKFSPGKDGVSTVTVTLDPSDTYSVGFWKGRGLNMKQVKTHAGVYARDLRPLFERQTGLRLSLGARTRP